MKRSCPSWRWCGPRRGQVGSRSCPGAVDLRVRALVSDASPPGGSVAGGADLDPPRGRAAAMSDAAALGGGGRVGGVPPVGSGGPVGRLRRLGPPLAGGCRDRRRSPRATRRSPSWRRPGAHYIDVVAVAAAPYSADSAPAHRAAISGVLIRFSALRPARRRQTQATRCSSDTPSATARTTVRCHTARAVDVRDRRTVCICSSAGSRPRPRWRVRAGRRPDHNADGYEGRRRRAQADRS
ncbi:hypothetical protein SBADM41S_02985 [Streptomyces badius]